MFKHLWGLYFFIGTVHALQFDPLVVDKCAEVSQLVNPSLDITVAEYIDKGKFKAPDNKLYELPAFCRIRATAKPTDTSNIVFELWMPTGTWNGRYRQLGNSGYSGSIQFGPMADSLRDGAAVAASNDGHLSDSGFDASWAFKQPELIIDYGYRSLSTAAHNAKRIIKQFYGREPDYNYFLGCSNGGRQALTVTQKFADDWDGVLAGAPAINWTTSMLARASNYTAQWGEEGVPLPYAKLSYIQDETLKACSPDAHLINGVAADPRFCRLTPKLLMCNDKSYSNSCLTEGEAKTLDTIYNGAKHASGHTLHTGFEPTAEAYLSKKHWWQGWRSWLVPESNDSLMSKGFAEGFFRYFLLEKPEWKLEEFTVSKYAALIKQKKIKNMALSEILDANNPNLTDFKNNNGKLLMYFGWNDEVLSPQSAVNYYEQVATKYDGIDNTQSFFRLFMVPGMMHCIGGPGAASFGQSGRYLPALKDDRFHNIIIALENWVERGIAPETLIATKYLMDEPESGVEFTRPLCLYPKVPVFKDGNVNVASSFECEDGSQYLP